MTRNQRREPSQRETPVTEALVQERVGLTAQHLPKEERARRVRATMLQAGFTDDAAFATFLRTSQSSLLDVAGALSVGETYFFRDPAQLRLFTDEVLPRLLLARPLEHVLKIWSAGCASGEEPYTIAMLLDERGLLERACIVATDISHAALEQARAGLYGSWSLRAMPPMAGKRYLQPVGRNYQLSAALRAAVQFERRSLIEGAPACSNDALTRFDVIFCRNVLIYLTPEACAQVSRLLANSLAPGGVLLTGASDPFLDLPALWQRGTSEAGVLYRRLESAVAPASSARGAQQAPKTDTAAPRPNPARAPARPSLAHAPTRSSPPAAPSPSPPASASERIKLVAKRDGAEQAVAACREQLGRQPLAAELHLLHASLLIELGRDAEAAEALRGLLYLDATAALGHFLSGLVFRRQGERRKAARAYRRVVALCAAHPEDAPVPWGDGVSHRGLAEAAAHEAYALDGQGGAP
jgi:chemotaxis protein methyltransferase CheR